MKGLLKITALLMTVFMLFGLASCDLLGGEDKVQKQEYQAASEAYAELSSVHDSCVTIMDSIYNAWHFSIYKYDDYSTYTGLNEFSDAVGISKSELRSTLETLSDTVGITDYVLYGILEDFSVAANLVVEVYKARGTFDEMEASISTAKAKLKEVTPTYADYTGYDTLKDYYSEVAAYAEFCESPTGSFEMLKTTIDNYETNLRNYRNDLSFVFD